MQDVITQVESIKTVNGDKSTVRVVERIPEVRSVINDSAVRLPWVGVTELGTENIRYFPARTYIADLKLQLSCFVRGEGATNLLKRDDVSLKLTNLLDDIRVNLVHPPNHNRGGIAIDTKITEITRGFNSQSEQGWMQVSLLCRYRAKTAAS